jgi:hypothetical protein
VLAARTVRTARTSSVRGPLFKLHARDRIQAVIVAYETGRAPTVD